MIHLMGLMLQFTHDKDATLFMDLRIDKTMKNSISHTHSFAFIPGLFDMFILVLMAWGCITAMMWDEVLIMILCLPILALWPGTLSKSAMLLLREVHNRNYPDITEVNDHAH
jgi:uncharacterized membrane protein